MNGKASGNFVLRLPSELHAALREEAARQGISLNELCRKLLADHRERAQAAERAPAGDDPGWLKALHELLGSSLLGVVLFGSEARGEAREGSDVDLLIVVGDELPLTRRLYARWDELLPDDKRSPHFVHLPRRAEEAGSLWLEASVDGIVVSDPRGEIGRSLGRIRKEIAAGRRRRLTAHGHPYWIDTSGGDEHVQ